MLRNSQTLNGGVGSGANSIFFDKRELSTNHVHLIGKICSITRFHTHSSGRRVCQFTVSTNENYLDENGETKSKQYKHRVCAWGRWVRVLEEFGDAGIQIALEGKLVSRFYIRDGVKQYISEVEANDLVIMS